MSTDDAGSASIHDCTGKGFTVVVSTSMGVTNGYSQVREGRKMNINTYPST